MIFHYVQYDMVFYDKRYIRPPSPLPVPSALRERGSGETLSIVWLLFCKAGSKAPFRGLGAVEKVKQRQQTIKFLCHSDTKWRIRQTILVWLNRFFVTSEWHGYLNRYFTTFNMTWILNIRDKEQETRNKKQETRDKEQGPKHLSFRHGVRNPSE